MSTAISLGEVARVFNGKTPSKREQRSVGHPVLKIKDVSENGCFRGSFDSFVDEDFHKRHGQRSVHEGDVLVLNAAHNADYVASKQYRAERCVSGAIATGEWLIARSNDPKLFQGYLWHWFQSPETRFEIRRRVRGIHLYPKDVASIQIPLPPLTEQRRIAAILDKADAIRRKREQALAMCDDFLRSVFLEMFGDLTINTMGWQTVKFEEIMTASPQNGLYRPSKDYGSGVPILRIDSFHNDRSLPQKMWKRLALGQSDLAKYSLSAGDIVVNRVNSLEYLGKCTLIGQLDEAAVFESNMMRIKIDEELADAGYMVDQMRSEFVRNQILRSAKKAVNQASINQNDVKALEIRLPPISLQKKYRGIGKVVKEMQADQSVFLTQSDSLFGSISQSAFRGELSEAA